MTEEKQQLDQLTEIRKMMSRSSKFISLSGFSGIWVGSVALIGLAAIFYSYPNYFYLRYMNNNAAYPGYMIEGAELLNFTRFVLIDAVIVLLLSISGAMFFTKKKANIQGIPLWNDNAKQFIIALLVPLVSGGAFIIISMYHGLYGIAGPLALIVYGLALFNSARYSVSEIRHLGLWEIGLGLLAAIFVGYTAIFWGIGFGVLHIVYGMVIYLKYDRK